MAEVREPFRKLHAYKSGGGLTMAAVHAKKGGGELKDIEVLFACDMVTPGPRTQHRQASAPWRDQGSAPPSPSSSAASGPPSPSSSAAASSPRAVHASGHP